MSEISRKGNMPMLRKIVIAFMLAAIFFESGAATALADPGSNDLVIKKGDQSDNVILLQLRLQDLGYYNYKVTGLPKDQ
jgi:peptidoglycan hydrolase-like protein with peptidoglycan-binding domain